MADFFFRSQRALKNDHPRSFSGGIALASLIMSLWLIWFFKAPISVYETSISARLEIAGLSKEDPKTIQAAVVTPQPTLIAEFLPSRGSKRIRPGQKARLWTTNPAGREYGYISTQVIGIRKRNLDGHLWAEIAVDEQALSFLPLSIDLSGLVEVEVERKTPACLVFGSASFHTKGLQPIQIESRHAQ